MGLLAAVVWLQELTKLRGGSAFIAGERPSLGDFSVAPICFLV